MLAEERRHSEKAEQMAASTALLDAELRRRRMDYEELVLSL